LLSKTSIQPGASPPLSQPSPIKEKEFDFSIVRSHSVTCVDTNAPGGRGVGGVEVARSQRHATALDANVWLRHRGWRELTQLELQWKNRHADFGLRLIVTGLEASVDDCRQWSHWWIEWPPSKSYGVSDGPGSRKNRTSKSKATPTVPAKASSDSPSESPRAKRPSDGGAVAIRGFLIQALGGIEAALVPATDQPRWFSMTFEPRLQGTDKVDILWRYDDGSFMAEQVKSTIGQFQPSEVRKWADSLKAWKHSEGATSYQLTLAGPCASARYRPLCRM